MRIHEWEVWHCYSSYFPRESIDLKETARRVVSSGFAPAALISSGTAFWTASGEIHRHEVDIPDGLNDGVQFPEGIEDAPEYAVEGIGQSIDLRVKERVLFGEDIPLPPRHLRFLPGRCDLWSPEDRTWLYPNVKLYETGVVTVSLRALCPPDASVGLREFVADNVNRPSRPYEAMFATPAVARLGTVASRLGHESSFTERAQMGRRQAHHARQVADLTISEDDGSFVHHIAPIARSAPATTLSVAQALIDMVGLLTIDHPLVDDADWPETHGDGLERPSGPSWLQILRFALRGDPPGAERHGFWVGRPHVHIVRHEDQARTASVNEQRWGDAFGAIMARSTQMRPRVARSFLPDDLRRFEDYSVYTNEAVTLWVHAEEGLERRRSAGIDPNRSRIIYEHQVVGELLDYGYANHRQLARYANAQDVGIDGVLMAQRNLANLREAMLSVSRYGEIRELLQAGWEALGADQLGENIREALAVREAEARVAERRQRGKRATALSLVIAGAAVVPLTNGVTKPLWHLLGLPLPKDAPLGHLLLVVMTFVVLIGIVAVGFRWGGTTLFGREGPR